LPLETAFLILGWGLLGTIIINALTSGRPSEDVTRASGQQVMPRRPSGPHVVHFSNVREVAEKEAGRFEFFKQMLAVGLAGIGGIAAIFTETGKIPEWPLLRVSLAIFAICAVVVVISSSDGISVYANHLRDVRKLADNTNEQQEQSLKRKVDASERSILTHAKWAIAASWVGALSLLIFAILRLIWPDGIGVEGAMKRAREIITEQSGSPSLIRLDKLETSPSEYIISYLTEPGDLKYTFKIKRDDYNEMEIVPSH
jgi:hypothetical protein